MGPPTVVVLAIGSERSIQMPPPPDERPVEALGPHRLDHPFRVGVRVWSLDRGADHPHPLRAQDRVERSTELRVPVADEEPDGARPNVEAQRQVASLLGPPRRVRVRGRGAHMDPPAAELDEHKDVERPEPDGLDREEVAGDDSIRLSPQELGPARAGPSRGRTEPCGPQQGTDRRRAGSDAELPELALDPDAAPARVLPGHPEDERTEFGIDRRPAKAARPAVGPLPLHQLSVPAEQRRRRDEEGYPSISRDPPTRRREEHPVDGPELRSASRPLQHPELMAEDEDLEVLGAVVPVTPAGADDEGDEGANEQVEERPHQPIVPGRSEHESGFPTPTGCARRGGGG